MAQIDEVSRDLGELKGRVLSLIQVVEQSENRAERRWDSIYERFDAQDKMIDGIRDDATGVRADVRYLRDTLTADVKPVTDEVKRWKAMGMGVLGIVGIGGAAVGTLLSAPAFWLWDNFAKLFFRS